MRGDVAKEKGGWISSTYSDDPTAMGGVIRLKGGTEKSICGQ